MWLGTNGAAMPLRADLRPATSAACGVRRRSAVSGLVSATCTLNNMAPEKQLKNRWSRVTCHVSRCVPARSIDPVDWDCLSSAAACVLLWQMIGVIVPIGLGGVVFFALWFWAILDCIATDSVLVRNLPKTTWLFVVILLSMPGALAWLLLGRPEGAGLGIGGTYRPANYTQRGRNRGFEDSTEWQTRSKSIKPPPVAAAAAEISESSDITESDAVKERRLLEWEAELHKREAALDDDPPTESD